MEFFIDSLVEFAISFSSQDVSSLTVAQMHKFMLIHHYLYF
jgi:hypothetical protein